MKRKTLVGLILASSLISFNSIANNLPTHATVDIKVLNAAGIEIGNFSRTWDVPQDSTYHFYYYMKGDDLNNPSFYRTALRDEDVRADLNKYGFTIGNTLYFRFRQESNQTNFLINFVEYNHLNKNGTIKSPYCGFSRSDRIPYTVSYPTSYPIQSLNPKDPITYETINKTSSACNVIYKYKVSIY